MTCMCAYCEYNFDHAVLIVRTCAHMSVRVCVCVCVCVGVCYLKSDKTCKERVRCIILSVQRSVGGDRSVINYRGRN